MNGKHHWAIPLAQAGAKWLPAFRQKQRLLLRCLPPRGRYLTPIGKLIAELDYTDIFERLAALGMWGRRVAEEMIPYLQPGDSFCDCGAHIGIVSLWVASHLGEGGLVYGFEPSPPTLNRLQTNFTLAQSFGCKMEAFPYALGSACGTLDLLVSSQNGWSTFSPQRDTLSQKLGATVLEVKPVRVLTLDDFFLGNQKRRLPQALKIDVEGWEEEFLRGAIQFLRQAPPRIIMLEKHALGLQVMNLTLDAIDQLLNRVGYHMVKDIPPEGAGQGFSDALYLHG